VALAVGEGEQDVEDGRGEREELFGIGRIGLAHTSTNPDLVFREQTTMSSENFVLTGFEAQRYI
jgi:hypothetical protein